uniref:Uncharacterized protein n=1 Tax=Molossus molossus TaxID=27622 RepID=A0A7J8JY83_MOLMO|nr:hypothetical protein HJG59_008063 [Molossus molossus]
MKKPRSEKPFPQSEPLTYRTGSLAAETQERSVVCNGAVCLPADQDSTRLRLSTTDALSCSGVRQNGGCALRHFWERPWNLPPGSKDGSFREVGAGIPRPASDPRRRSAGPGAGTDVRATLGPGAGRRTRRRWRLLGRDVRFLLISCLNLP